MKHICLLVFLFVTQFIYSQKNNTSSRKLPFINLAEVSETAYEPGKISVKYHRHQLEKIQQNKLVTGEILFNNAFINALSFKYHFTKYNLLFSNVLSNNEFKQQHIKWDLDLWFTIEFDAQKSVKQLYAELQQANLFEIVEPVYKKHLLDDNIQSATYIPNDARFNEQWNYNNTTQGGGKISKDIKLMDAWDIETGKPNVIVAVHDMGIQLNHPDLEQNIAVGKSFNFIDNSTTIVEGYHGTHTAGTIAAVNNNGIGVSGIAGGNGAANSGARLMSIQIFKGHQGAGFAEGFIYAADNGAAISSNSWAYDIEDVYELSTMDAIDYFIENGGGNVIQGGLVIFAAGNKSNDIRFYPSAYDRVICVAATNNRDEKANYSTYGSWVDIAAPGGDYSNEGASQVLSTTVGNGYAGDHGTSMACPHVAGVAALITSKLSGKASASDVRDILLSTTDNVDSLNPNFVGLLGTGRLNAFKALQKAQAIGNSISVDAVSSFKATFNCNAINLNWQKNNTNNDVLVAYSNTNKISGLTNGNGYSVGDKIGDGIIVYKGSATNFTIPANQQQLHFFKIWSANSNNEYSFGKTAEMVTPVVVEASGVVTQNFDFPPYFPTQEWRTVNTDNDISWSHTAADTANTGAGDLYSMCMYNYQYNTQLGTVDILTSPIYSIGNADAVSFSFWYAYKYRNTMFAIADTLEVLISKDCGVTYQSLWKNAGIDLATVNGYGDSVFYPFGMDKWKQVTFDISSYRNNQLMFAFKATNGKGNNLFIDNINVDIRYKTDVAVTKIVSPVIVNCDTEISPQVQINNKGKSSINSLKINYSIDGGQSVSSNWNGSVAKNDSVIINLNAASVTSGNHQIKVYSFLPNNTADDYRLNDTVATSFFITPAATLPLIEGFEGNMFPPNGWYISQKPVDKITWVKTNQFGKGSSSSVVMKNFVYDNEARTDDLLTPYFIIDRNMDSAFLLFDYAYATRKTPVNTKDYDSLEIAISRDCGTSWNTIWKKGGGALRTTVEEQPFNEFLPKSNQWKSDSLMIMGSFAKGDKIQLRFRNTEYFENNLYIDNIKLYSTYYAPATKQNGYAIYPNPVTNYMVIQHLNEPSNLQYIRVVNSVGKIVFSKQIVSNASKNMQLNTSAMPSGVYVLQLIYADKTVNEKFIKIN